MTTLQDYIKLAEAQSELMPLEQANHCRIEFDRASIALGPAMAQALIEAEEALQGMVESYEMMLEKMPEGVARGYVEGFFMTDATTAKQALSTIQKLKEMP